jgi:ATP-binding cassette subfamily C (CFTR/MRP) protein 1
VLTLLQAARGAITGPLLVLTLILMQASLTLNAYALVWWENKYVHQPRGMSSTNAPAARSISRRASIRRSTAPSASARPSGRSLCTSSLLSFGRAVLTRRSGVVMDYMSSFVSSNLHHKSVTNIFRAPMSFFDSE